MSNISFQKDIAAAAAVTTKRQQLCSVPTYLPTYLICLPTKDIQQGKGGQATRRRRQFCLSTDRVDQVSFTIRPGTTFVRPYGSKDSNE